MGRRASREVAMKLLYQTEIQKSDREWQLNFALENKSFNSKDNKYIRDIVDGVFNNIEEIDLLIEKHAIGWKLNRISKVDLSILRVGIYEILYRKDIPYNVSINEAVEMAKKYSTKEAGSFINGILSKIPKFEASSPENDT
ncbi:MAG TPA: transcription antitermination factor NusB [Clostridiaceae bacterium]|jgi:N utilization substance protein B|nr:transcription antitermination factor NusB [Clostridiaceae bacterium]